MRRILIVITLVAATSSWSSVRRDIDCQYKRWSKASLKNDVRTILSILAPNYELHTYTGKLIGRKAYEDSLRRRRDAKQPATAYQTKIVSLTVQGQKASVISDELSAKVTVDPVTEKRLKLVHIHRYLDSWVRLSGKWRLAKTVTTVESTRVLPIGN